MREAEWEWEGGRGRKGARVRDEGSERERERGRERLGERERGVVEERKKERNSIHIFHKHHFLLFYVFNLLKYNICYHTLCASNTVYFSLYFPHLPIFDAPWASAGSPRASILP